jgi:hypothetical protein
MRPLTLVLTAVLLLPACGGESACERYERIGAAGDMDSGASPEEVREATEALAECMAEEGDQR